MFISRVRSKGKNGRQYVSILLRHSKRTGKKVVSQTIAILTGLPDWLLAIVESAVENGKDAAFIEALVESSRDQLALRCAESFGDVFLVHEVAKACGIVGALGASHEGQLALWQVCARVISPATSLLAMVRNASTCAATALLGFRSRMDAWVAQSNAVHGIFTNRPS